MTLGSYLRIRKKRSYMILIVTKVIKAESTDAAIRKRIFDAVGFNFLSRLLSSMKAAKLTNHLTFLKRCRDSHIIPAGLQLISPVDYPKANHILNEASVSLTRERITHTRHELHNINALISTTLSRLNRRLNPGDLHKITTSSQDTANQAFRSTRLKIIKKFNQLVRPPPTPTENSRQPKPKDTVVNLSGH
nr:uncharacterized protein LOC129261464 [Lytechinus pictus]